MSRDTNTLTQIEDAIDRAANYLGEWADQGYVANTMLQHERFKMGDAAHPLQLALSAIIDAQRFIELLTCDECGGDGILWPVGTDGDESHAWIEACDACKRFEYDDEAAIALGEKLERDVMQAIHPTLNRFAPFLDERPFVRYFVTDGEADIDVVATGPEADFEHLKKEMYGRQILWRAAVVAS